MARFTAGLRPIVRRLWSALTTVLLLVSWSAGAAFAQPAVPPTASPGQLLPADDASQLPQPRWRHVFPYRSAFGSLCPLAPLACALIDRPFAFSARLELFLRPNASDGSTSLLLPFTASVPLFGRVEIGLGSCYVGFWNSNQEANKTAVDPSTYRTSGLCPLWLAGKLLLFPWFRDAHTHPALSVEYQGEYQAGPFNGLNQLGLPGPLSKVSLAYRHPLSRLEVAGAASVLVDHTTRAGAVQFGGHVGYRLPVGEHFWIFGQTLAQLPFFGSAIEERQARQMPSLAPPAAGTLVVGAQQRADFGFGVGLSLMLTKSEQETRVEVLVRLLSFEIGPHIKALFPARPKVDEPPKVEARVVPPPTVPSLCSPAHPPTPDCVPAPLPKAVYERLPGSPCFLYSPDGSEQLEMGHIDSTSHFCDWDGLHLPLGAVIPPRTPDALPSSQRPGPVPSPAPRRETRHQPLAHRVLGNKLTKSIVVPPAAQPSGTTAPLPAVAVDAGARFSPCVPPPSLWRRGMSPVTQGFADGAVEACQHAEQIYKVIKEHGPLVVLPRPQDMVDWWQQTKQECLDQLGPCIREKAQEAHAELDRFRRLSWEQKQYELGKVGFQVVEQTVINAVLPGGAAATSTGIKAAEHAAEEQLAKAAKRKLEKEAAERAAEAAAKKAAQEAAAAEAKRVAEEEAKRVAEAEAKRVAEAEAKRAAEERAAGSGRKRGIYEFPDQAADGKPYVGQSGNISQRLKQHEQSGRLTPGTETTHAVDGGKTAREIAEHQRIQEITGGVPARQSPDVANKVDPIGPNRRHWLEKK